MKSSTLVLSLKERRWFFYQISLREVQETLHQITLLVKANMQDTWVTVLKLQLLAVWMDGNLALYPSSIVFLQIPIQQLFRKTLLIRKGVQFPLSLLIWILEGISYATQINDSPCFDRIHRLNLSVHLT